MTFHKEDVASALRYPDDEFAVGQEPPRAAQGFPLDAIAVAENTLQVVGRSKGWHFKKAEQLCGGDVGLARELSGHDWGRIELWGKG